jgi:outer membrane protein OmpA-like peptidoglycan-associated protein
MRLITRATLGALIAAAPAAAVAQAIKSAPTIEQQLMPSVGQSLGSGQRGIGLARTPPAAAVMPADPALEPAAASQPAASEPTAPPVAAAPAPARHPASASHPAATHPTAAQEPAAPAGIAAADLTVLFAFHSAELTPEGIAQLNELARALTGEALSGYRFRIEGYTDTVGAPDYNKTLSERRAAAVLDYLVANGHVSADRLQAVGFGKSHLLVPTPDQTPEPRNRRVRIVNLGN